MLKSMLSRIRAEALSALYPLHCLGCGEEGGAICQACRVALPRLAPPYCRVCAQPGVGGTCNWCRENAPAIDRIAAPYLYVGSSPIYRAIGQLKFRGVRAVAPELAGLLAAFLDSRRMVVDLIVPVSSHRSRLRSRGFNQAALIAEELGRLVSIPVRSDLLVRTKNARSQLGMGSREDRWLNVRENFECVGSADGLRILLVDDLVTTGATMSACAHALKGAGASRVVGLAVARAP